MVYRATHRVENFIKSVFVDKLYYDAAAAAVLQPAEAAASASGAKPATATSLPLPPSTLRAPSAVQATRTLTVGPRIAVRLNAVPCRIVSCLAVI